MKKKILLFGFILAALSGLGIFLFFSGSVMSDAQKETVALLGNPDQFVITYLPRGSEDEMEMVRSEVWYYATLGKRISFLAGELVVAEDYRSELPGEPTVLVPWDFDVLTDFEEIEKSLGAVAVVPIADLPVFAGEDVQTYLSPGAIFIFEQGYLTYFQTVVEGELTQLPTEAPTPTVPLAPSKRITNSVYGFTIDLPADWFLGEEDIVLSSYDTDFMAKQLPLPETRVKCDFVLPFGEVEIEQRGVLIENESLAISRCQITGSEGDGPGFGAGLVYQIQSSDKDELWLVCFMADEPQLSQLEGSLGTFAYVP